MPTAADILQKEIRKRCEKHNVKLEPSATKLVLQWLQSTIDTTDTKLFQSYCANIAKSCKEQSNNLQGCKITDDIVQSVLTTIEQTNKTVHNTNRDNDENDVTMSNVPASNQSTVKQPTSKQIQYKLPNISVINAYDMPRYKYDLIQKQYRMDSNKRSIAGNVNERTEMLIERYTMHWQRLQRNELFAVPVTTLSMHSHTTYHEIVDITSLLSRGAYSGKCIIFGMLTSVGSDTDYCIEDCMSRVVCDITDATVANGYYFNYCLVLAEGELRDNDVFYITSIGHPPSEHRDTTLSAYPVLDLFGCNNTVSMRQSEIDIEKQYQLTELINNKSHEHDMIVILSDVHIDDVNVMTRLKTLFDGLSAAQPAVFVFMGNFISKPIGTSNAAYQQLKYYFDQLADLILLYPTIAKQSHFVFIPGPHDPTLAGTILPSAGLPPHLTQRLTDKVTHCTIGSNPCRLMYYGREIVLYRDNLLQKSRRHTVLQPPIEDSNHTQYTEHLVKTIVEQSHLSPFNITLQPIVWSYDHSLRLNPLPDLLVLGDCVDQYCATENCLTVNPGQFNLDYSFVVYKPQANIQEFSRVP